MTHHNGVTVVLLERMDDDECNCIAVSGATTQWTQQDWREFFLLFNLYPTEIIPNIYALGSCNVNRIPYWATPPPCQNFIFFKTSQVTFKYTSLVDISYIVSLL